ncbi:CD209 antigen-like protein A [Aulostomus maculatus]
MERGEREERWVDIYQGSDSIPKLECQAGGANTPKHRPVFQVNNSRAAAVILLALLCLLLFIGVAVLSKLYASTSLDRDQLRRNYSDLAKKSSQLEEEVNQLCGQSCPREWVRWRCSCYYISTEKKSWEDSRKDCCNKGADLVIINNQEEQKFVRSQAKGGAWWIGLTVTKKWEGKWEWVDSSQLSYTNWGKKVATVPKQDSQVYIREDGHWNLTSGGNLQWICEINGMPKS